MKTKNITIFFIIYFLTPLALFANDNNVTFEEVTNTQLSEIKIILYIIAVATTLILGSLQFYFNRKHQKNTYAINRLNNTMATVRQSTSGEIKNVYMELKKDLFELGLDGYFWDETKTIKDVLELDIKNADGKENSKKAKCIFRIKNNTYNLLNFYDCIATSIESELIEPAMIFNHYSLMVIDMYRWAKPIIDEENSKDDFVPWYPFQQMAKAYIQNQDILKDELNNHKNSIYTKQVTKVK